MYGEVWGGSPMGGVGDGSRRWRGTVREGMMEELLFRFFSRA